MTPRLFLSVFSIEARKLMSYRVDFWINTLIGSLANFVLVYFLWAAIFHEPGQIISGYSFDGMVLYYVFTILLGKLVTGPSNPTDVAQDVYDGVLSRYLLFPASYLLLKYAQRLGLLLPSLVQMVLLFGLYLLFLPFPQEVAITPSSVLMGLVSLAIANALYFVISATLQLVSFWADNVWSLVVMMMFVSRLLGGAMLPLDVFPDGLRPWLSALPFGYFFGFPIDTLMGRVPPSEWAAGMLISLLWLVALTATCRLVWRRGMLQYTGVGI